MSQTRNAFRPTLVSISHSYCYSRIVTKETRNNGRNVLTKDMLLRI